MEWELGVRTAEYGHKVVFKRLDGAFSGIATIDVWWYQLEVDAFGSDGSFERC